MSISWHIPIHSHRRRGSPPRPSFAGRARGMTPLGAVVRGLVAGATGTAAMDALLSTKNRGHGEEGFELWESSPGLDSWERAPAPAQVGKRLVDGLFARQMPPQRAQLLNNITHWAYGILGGAQCGIVAGSLWKPRIRYGLPFGAGVWAAAYVLLPAARLYEPVWKCDRVTSTQDLSAHLVYGLGTAAPSRLLAGTTAGTS